MGRNMNIAHTEITQHCFKLASFFTLIRYRLLCVTDPNVPEPRPEPCSKRADVVFVVDSSTLLDLDKLRTYVVAAIQNIVANLRIDTQHTRVAFVTYSVSARV